MTHDRAFDLTGQLRTGRHLLQIPGPTHVPDEVLRAMSAPTIDHRGPEFAVLLSFNAVSAKALEASRAAGLPNVFARHQRHAAATREAVRAWGLEVLRADEREHSGSLTAVLVLEEHDADDVRRTVLDRFDMSLGAGLGKLAGLPVETDGVAAALAVLEKE